MSGLGRVVRSGVRRRRVPSLVVALATFAAVTAQILAGSLLVASSAPFDHAFATQRGAHLIGEFDARKAGPATIAPSAHAAGVTASAGPFPTVSATPAGAPGRLVAMPPMTLAGRADPGGPVDAVSLVSGRWVRGQGELVVAASGPEVGLGTVLHFPDLPGAPSLTVVGTARSVSQSADGWVEPAVLSAPTGYQMLYRFFAAATAAQVAADRAAITAAVPPGAVAGVQSWLAVRQAADQNTGAFVPFLAAFGVLGLAVSVLIVANVVAGSVAASVRRIGVLKALGCTPAQVVRAYVTQALVPAAAGTLLGVLAGNLPAVPVLAQTDAVYDSAASGVVPWVDVLVALAVPGVVAVTAWLTAWRAGRLRTVDALAVGRAATGGRGRWAARTAARLPLPRTVALGLSHPFARPARSLGLLSAVAFGTVTVTLALGLGSSLQDVRAAQSHAGADVVVDTLTSPYGPHRVGGPRQPNQPTGTPADIAAAIAAQPGTGESYTMAQGQVTVAGLSGPADLYCFAGDASWGGYQMVSGRWFHGPGEAVVVSSFRDALGARLGDTVTLLYQGRPVPVRLVGEVFDPHSSPEVLVDAATVPGLAPQSFYVKLRPGTDGAAYLAGLDGALAPYHLQADADRATSHSGTLRALDALTGLLTLMLVAVAALGVLNTVVLDTRDRAHDIGVVKAIGMTPRQTTAMVLASVLPAGLAGGLLGVPLGYAAHAALLPAMGHAVGLRLPQQALAVYRAPELAVLAAGGLVIAVLGALAPATWASRIRTATVLRTE